MHHLDSAHIGRSAHTYGELWHRDETWVEPARVREKTAERTVSPEQWRRIKRGMTVERVGQIVGYSGGGLGSSFARSSYADRWRALGILHGP